MQKLRAVLLLAAAPLLVGSGCHYQADNTPTAQGWTWGQRDAWYVADQGSRLIPQKWIDALEQPVGAATVGNGKFVDPGYLSQFNYASAGLFARKDVDAACPVDPNLPIGFVTTCEDDSNFGVTRLNWLSTPQPHEAWVGMNCSACHSNAMELHYTDGKPNPTETLLVDGAPTLGDFQHFMAALERSLEQTYQDDQKFARFAAAVLPGDDAAADMPKLKQAMASLISWNKKLAAVNADEGTRYGYGRLDAIGHIFNKVALAALRDGTQISNPSDAPVSYPFLWNVTELNKVEWNGIADNTPTRLIGTVDFGALGRNTGEVTGVFADVVLTPGTGIGGFTSSARTDRLDEMEQQLRSLRAPVWPMRFGLDQGRVDKGRALFATDCASCHHTTPDKHDSLGDHYTVALTPLSEIGTDIWMACNASFDQARAGALKGEKQNMVIGDLITDPAFNLSLVQGAVVGSIIGQKGTLVASTLAGLFGFDNGLPQPQNVEGLAAISPKTIRENTCRAAMADKTSTHYGQLVYKGRPLQGIWATAPYLHNGSVPSLYTLLLPADKRPKMFFVGSHVFDPKEVGFVYGTPGPNSYEFDVVDPSGHGIAGNSNSGHDYNNAALSDDDRYAIIEYLKTL